jgi:malonyl-CoA/methylmalonyl-CoA synthetase
MSLLPLLDASLLARRDTLALEFAPDSAEPLALTFGDLEDRSNRMAHVLATRGLVAGDRLAVFLTNCVEFVDLYLACIKLGVIFVPVNVLYREREIRHILGDAEPRAVVTNADLAPHLGDAVNVWLIGELAADAAGKSSDRPAYHATGDDPAALVYTSGTTGASKGAILTHHNFAANAANLVAWWEFTAADRLLCTLPLFHIHGLGNAIHCWLASGCHMRLLERFDHATALDVFEAYRPTVFFGVPTMYVRLLASDPARAAAIGATMRLFVSGSAPLPAHVLEEFRTKFGQTILERYGMTETLMNISNPYGGERRAGTIGFPLPGVSVRIVDEAGATLHDGEAGELLVRGPNVCAGYWRRDDATRAAFTDGWFRTGDIGVRSTDGYFTLQGRRSDLIISGGFNIYPREIEETLMEIPGVREAAVVGQPDPIRGEVPIAYLVTDVAIDTAMIEATLRSQLASFKIPRGYVSVDALPRTALGKVQRHLLPKWSPT